MQAQCCHQSKVTTWALPWLAPDQGRYIYNKSGCFSCPATWSRSTDMMVQRSTFNPVTVCRCPWCAEMSSPLSLTSTALPHTRYSIIAPTASHAHNNAWISPQRRSTADTPFTSLEGPELDMIVIEILANPTHTMLARQVITPWNHRPLLAIFRKVLSDVTAWCSFVALSSNS